MNKIIDFNISEIKEDINIVSKIENMCIESIPLTNEEINILLNNLSYTVREKIASFENQNPSDYSYSYKCDLAQAMIYYYLKNLNINVNTVNTNEVIKDVCGHSLLLADFKTTEDEKLYLIDPTYIQFFSKEKCDIKNFIIIKDKICKTPDPGFFVIQSGKENILMPLLVNGYILFNEEVAKVYGDSFFKTKQGTPKDKLNNNTLEGREYINLFEVKTSNLSKTEKDLIDMNLLIEPVNNKEKRK